MWLWSCKNNTIGQGSGGRQYGLKLDATKASRNQLRREWDARLQSWQRGFKLSNKLIKCANFKIRCFFVRKIWWKLESPIQQFCGQNKRKQKKSYARGTNQSLSCPWSCTNMSELRFASRLLEHGLYTRWTAHFNSSI